MALGRRRFTRAIVVRPPLDFTAASGDATVAAETAAVALAAGAPTATGAARVDAAAETLALAAPAPSVTGAATVAAEPAAFLVVALVPAVTGSGIEPESSGGHWSIPVTKQRKGLGAFDGDEDDEAAILTALLTLA